MARQRGSWQLVPNQHKEILRLLRAGHGICKVAAIVGVGVRTVQRRADLIREALAVEIDYRRVIKSQRCEVHGLVSVWPCVACAAEAAKRSAERN